MDSNISYSSNDYKRLGERIRSNPKQVSDADLMMLQTLRVSYKEPLAIIFKSIEKAANKVDENCICTYRVKRIESIISKLVRFPHMQVNKAEDIAGCRCIMTHTENVYKLFDKLQRNKDRLPFEIADTIIKYNYIEKIGEVFARNYLDVRRQWNKMRLQRNHFFLISTGSDASSPSTIPSCRYWSICRTLLPTHIARTRSPLFASTISASWIISHSG